MYGIIKECGRVKSLLLCFIMDKYETEDAKKLLTDSLTLSTELRVGVKELSESNLLFILYAVCPHSVSVCVLLSAGWELIWFAAGNMVLCFRFVMKTVV